MRTAVNTKTTEQSKTPSCYSNNYFYHYYVFGLHIVAEFTCPELCSFEPEHSTPDVVIRMGHVPSRLDNPELNDGFSQVKPGAYLLHLDDIAGYYVTNGCEIVVQPREGCSIDLIRLYLFSQCIGALLHQRNRLILHASAVETKQGALVFIGPSGAGKSTLAAGFLDAGYKLLAEDLCVLEFPSEGGLQVVPGMAQLRLWNDTIQKLGHKKERMQRVWHKENKYSRLLQHEVASVSVPLERIYLLGSADVEQVMIASLSLPEMMGAIANNVFRLEYVKALGMQERLFRQTIELVRSGRIGQLIRPKNGFSVSQQIAQLREAHAC